MRSLRAISASTTGNSGSPAFPFLPTLACKCQQVQQGRVQAENFLSFNEWDNHKVLYTSPGFLEKEENLLHHKEKVNKSISRGGRKQTGRCQPSSWTGTGAHSSIQIPVSYCNCSFHHPPVFAQNYHLWVHSTQFSRKEIKWQAQSVPKHLT